MISIYLLLDPRPEKLNWIRYVGKTNDFKRRKSEHNREVAEIPKTRWVEKLKSLNLQPIMFSMAKVSKENWKQTEIELIAYYRSIRGKGVDILNISNGGDGGSNIGRKFPKSFGEKVSKSLKGRKLSQSHIENIRQGLKGKKKSLEHCKKIGDIHRGKIVSAETREKLSIANVGKIHSDEYRKKHLDKMKGFKFTISALEKISQTSKGRNHTPRPVLKFSLEGKFLEEIPSCAEAMRQYGRTVQNGCYRTCKSVYGFQWRFKDEVSVHPPLNLHCKEK